MSFLELTGTKLFYREVGSGRSVILVSGGGLDSTYWQPLSALLSPQYRCISFDHRGVGQSDKPPGPYTIEGFANDVVNMARSLELGPYYLVGHSMGGYIGQVVASRDPDCASLVLIGTAPRPPAETIYLMELRKSLRRQLDPELFRATGASWMFAPETFRENRSLIDAYIHGASARGGELQEHDSYDRHMDACIGFTNEPYASGISVPTLILVGANDGITPPSCSYELKQQLAMATVSEIDGAGHFVHIEKPDLVAKETLNFWSPG